MTLEKYKEKRDFNKNSKSKLSKSFTEKIIEKYKDVKLERPIYVIHEHHATHLHWDLRLEMDGVLKSWAIPKEPSDSGVKRLAILVEDHPLEYAAFEGVTPKGNYGAGTIKIWDKGIFEIIEKTDKGFVIKINGKKLNGIFVLFKFKPPKNWLFFKKKED